MRNKTITPEQMAEVFEQIEESVRIMNECAREKSSELAKVLVNYRNSLQATYTREANKYGAMMAVITALGIDGEYHEWKKAYRISSVARSVINETK